MRFSKTLATLLLAVASLVAPPAATQAAINAQNLGAKYERYDQEVCKRERRRSLSVGSLTSTNARLAPG